MTGEAKEAGVTPSSPLAPLRAGGELAAWIVLAFGIGLSVAAWYFARSVVERDARFRFKSATLAFEAAANTRIRSYADLLFGVQGLFQANPETRRADFDNYVYSLNLPVRYPGVRSISYARRVSAAEKAAFAEQLRNDPDLIRRGYANTRVRLAEGQAEHFLITYVEPLHANKAALGFDLAADPKRMAVVERARDTGMPALSGPVNLASVPGDSDTGLVMRLALYGKNAFTSDVERRRKAFVGLANVTFLVDELAQYLLLGKGHELFTLTIVDTGFIDSSPKPAPIDLYSNVGLRAPQAGPAFQDTYYVDLGQRRWELKIGAPQEIFFRPADHAIPWIALASVLMLSFLLSGLIHTLAGSRSRAHALAARMTTDLLESEAKLREEQRRTQELIEVLPNPIYFKGTDGRYLGVNKAWEAYFGMPRMAFVGKTVHDLYPDDPETAMRLEADDRALWNTPGIRSYEATITTPDGQVHNTIYFKATFADAGGATAGLIGTIVDITARKQTELRLALEHAVARLLSDSDPADDIVPRILQVIGEAMGCACGAYWVADEEAQAMVCAATWSIATPEVAEFAASNRQFRHPLQEPGGLFMRVWKSGEPVWVDDVTRDPRFRRAQLAIKAQLRGAFAFPVRAGADTSGVMEFFSHANRSPDDELLRSTIAIGSQIGQFMSRRKAEERIRHLAAYDELTGVVNRNMFGQRLNHALVRARRDNQQFAILFLDLDRFKNINDTLGHEAGDIVLKETGQRLSGCLRESDTVGRFGGDEFVILLEAMPQPTHSAVVAQKILAAIARPFTFDGQHFQITASIGISTYPGDSEDPQNLLKNADIAMYRAKEQGKNNYQFYSAQMNIHTRERLAMESTLRGALERDEFVLHYQPKIDLGSRRVVGMEALVRWQHPASGLIPPAQFIPIAEETGLIVPIGEWVMRTACAQSKSWREQGLPPLRIAVNLSPRQFAHEGLLLDVKKILSEAGLDSAALELEVTEGMVMHDPEHAAIVLGELKTAGVTLSIDDFGTGYSSLSYLKRFPIDSLKIDRSFVKDLPLDAEDAAITQAIIVMAHSLGLKVIAEGVETEAQAAFLRMYGCDEAQGYHFSKPVPAHEIARLLLDSAGAAKRPKADSKA